MEKRELKKSTLCSNFPDRGGKNASKCLISKLEFDNTADPAVETVSDLTPGLTPDLATDLATQAADPGWD